MFHLKSFESYPISSVFGDALDSIFSQPQSLDVVIVKSEFIFVIQGRKFTITQHFAIADGYVGNCYYLLKKPCGLFVKICLVMAVEKMCGF